MNLETIRIPLLSNQTFCGAGIPEDRARQYDEGVRKGGIVIGTRARDDAHATELERDYNTFGGTSVLR